MRSSMTLGTVSGIPIKIHLNWFLIAILVTWSLASGYFPQKHPGWQASQYWLMGTITAMLFFSSVLFHELGHALIAIQEGVPVRSITLFIFGGVAHIAHEPSTAESEFRIVAAGPFVSLALAAFYFLVSLLSPLLSPEVRDASLYLSQINMILAIFNLIPGFPLDGGRMLRAVLWKMSKDFDRATRWATMGGLGIAGLFILTGLALGIMDNLFNGLWVAFIGWYLGRAAIQQFRMNIEEDTPDKFSLRRALFGKKGKNLPHAGGPAYAFEQVLVSVEPEVHTGSEK